MNSPTEVKPENVLFIQYSLPQSIASDCVTFAMLAFLPWFNHEYCGGSGWINCAIAFAWFVVIINRASGMRAKMTKTPAQARQWLDDKFPS